MSGYGGGLYRYHTVVRRVGTCAHAVSPVVTAERVGDGLPGCGGGFHRYHTAWAQVPTLRKAVAHHLA